MEKKKYNNPFKKGDRVMCFKYESEIWKTATQIANIKNDCKELGNIYTVRSIESAGEEGTNFISINASYLHPYDCFIKVPKEVPIYENYAVECTSTKELNAVRGLQKKLFGDCYGTNVLVILKIIEFLSKTKVSKWGSAFSKDFYLTAGKNYGVERQMSFKEWEEMVEYEEFLNIKNNLNMEKETREVVAYKLLKDLPTVKAGVIFKKDTEENLWCVGEGSEDTYYGYSDSDMRNTEWFEPVFDEEVFELVKVSYDYDGGSFCGEFNVRVTNKGTITLEDVDGEEGFELDYKALKALTTGLVKLEEAAQKAIKGHWDISITLIDIGCKDEVAVGDLEEVVRIYEELNNIK